MMSNLKRTSDLGNEESKHTEPEHKDSKQEESKYDKPEYKESKDKEENKVYEAIALSWGG